jgi:hypothetical protein
MRPRDRDNPDAVRSPFHATGYVQAGVDALEELRRKQATKYADADRANNISDNYARLTVFSGRKRPWVDCAGYLKRETIAA